ncbi:DeoR/GlpR family DNA-binding transcription regulator [Paraburkholderia sp. B3]|uniref:DeoR/GlpR family DNA-binding transcription regulator n=1 Tax=Paraburkholderia sp. B3 TaxID=3134791 RepID=UPI003982469C
MQRTRTEALAGLMPDERERLILERLRNDGRVLAAQLATELNTSEHTVRRHLRDLADAGHCKRVYGGALLASPADRPLAARMQEDPQAKARLAGVAASIVQHGQVILLDVGSTNAEIAAALPDHADLTVITTSPEVCVRLVHRPGFKVVLIGGSIGPRVGGAVGATALAQLQQIRADLCFVGVCALDPAEGLAAFDADDAEMKRAMIRASGLTAAAVTSAKLMRSAPFTVAPVAGLDYLIVEPEVQRTHLAQLRKVCDNVLVARS